VFTFIKNVYIDKSSACSGSARGLRTSPVVQK
jgi:hypothetical protein